jgi:hypothetical protein
MISYDVFDRSTKTKPLFTFQTEVPLVNGEFIRVGKNAYTVIQIGRDVSPGSGTGYSNGNLVAAEDVKKIAVVNSCLLL